MHAARNLIVTLLWLVWVPSVLLTDATYDDKYNSYQPGQSIGILLYTLNKIVNAPSYSDEPDRETAPAFTSWLPINDQWEIDPNALSKVQSETEQ